MSSPFTSMQAALDNRRHFIEISFPGERPEYFVGWGLRDEPDLSPNRDDASKYDLMFHREECTDDYERLCNLGFDASIETTGFVRRDYSEAARLESWASHIN
jgi:hypothetical protein